MRYVVMTVPQTSMLPVSSDFRLIALIIAGLKSLFQRHVYVVDTDDHEVIFSRVREGQATLVRVCCYAGCPHPHGIYGCVSSPDKAQECTTCRLKKPGMYRTCALRRIAPHPAHATHGFCPTCVEKVRQDFRIQMGRRLQGPADLVA